IQGETSWAEGIGEKLLAIQLPETWFVIMIPPLAISTIKLFSHPRLTYNTTPIKIQSFLSGSLTTQNDFESIVKQDYPMMAEALDFLNHYAPARLSGTGASIFATLSSKIAAETLLEKIKAPYRGFLCKGLTTSPLQQIMKNWGVAKW
ncbi:MAG: 4-(cytidine 5'-diphospho)-2-C-methyl-D-erythritol kinase, partial [Candidatus Rickettsiella isopodorum]